MPGDFLMAIISDINLPLLSSDVFSRSALIIGKVKCFAYVNEKEAIKKTWEESERTCGFGNDMDHSSGETR